jgi:hypothetical protein
MSFFFVSPKRTEPAKNLIDCMRKWVSETFGDNMLRECSGGITTLGTLRESVVALGAVSPGSPESLGNFHQVFETQYSKQAFAYFRILSEFVTKTRGTAASKGLNNLELFWYHPFDASLGRVATDQLHYELCAVLWNIAAAYSICASFLPRELQIKCSKDSEGGIIEPVECLKHRTINFRRSAMMFELLEKIMTRYSYFVDEFNPKICSILRCVMLAQAQTCVYYARKGEELAQRLEHAALANAALRYYREAFQMIEGNLGKPPSPEGTPMDARDLSNPAEHIPRYLKPYCMACGIIVKVSMITHLMDIDKGDTTQHGRITGNCSRLCAMLRAYSIKVKTMEAYEDVAQMKALKPVYEDYTALLTSLEEKNKIFKEPVVDHDTLEKEDPDPVDQVGLKNINILEVSDGLRQVYTEEFMNKFSAIISQEAYRMWSDYRKRKATMYRVHCNHLAEFRTRLLAMMESPSARFPLLYLYFLAHSMGASKQCLAPAKTPLGAKAASLIQVDSAWTAFTSHHDGYLTREKFAAETARTLSIDMSDAKSAFERDISPTEVSHLSLDAPIERCKAIIEEYRGFKIERASEQVVQWATELRKAESFAKEIRNKISMPDAFWAQLCDPSQRIPFPQTSPRESDTALVAQDQSSFVSEGDGLVEEMLTEQIARARSDARTALKETNSSTPVAGSSKGSGANNKGGIFAMFGMGYSNPAPNRPISLDAAASQQQHKATQFETANPNLKTIKLMRLAVRVIDDVYLPIEELNDQLASSLIADLAKQNTEIPPSEMVPDLAGTKLLWLVKFTSSTDSYIKLGGEILEEMAKLELSKDDLIDEVNSNFGFSSAGGPPADSRCVLVTVCSGIMAALRGYRLCEKIYTEIPREGGFVSAQCKEVISLKSKPKKATNYGTGAKVRPPAPAHKMGHATPPPPAVHQTSTGPRDYLMSPQADRASSSTSYQQGVSQRHGRYDSAGGSGSSSSNGNSGPKPYI